jgi:hypothetical protein
MFLQLSFGVVLELGRKTLVRKPEIFLGTRSEMG